MGNIGQKPDSSSGPAVLGEEAQNLSVFVAEEILECAARSTQLEPFSASDQRQFQASVHRYAPAHLCTVADWWADHEAAQLRPLFPTKPRSFGLLRKALAAAETLAREVIEDLASETCGVLTEAPVEVRQALRAAIVSAAVAEMCGLADWWTRKKWVGPDDDV